MEKRFFLAREVSDSRERGTLTLIGVLPGKPGESFGSLEEAVKALEATSDPRGGWLIVEIISPQIEVKVTVPPDIQRFDATKKV